MKMAQW